MTVLRNLLWIYLVLLIFEGALRKWILPSLDAPLLVIRDPLVICIYVLAWKHRLSFSNAFFAVNLALAVATAAMSSVFGLGNAMVTLYGLRTDFLQVPLIFLIPQILDREDVIAMGRFLLYVSIPIVALVIFQFRSAPDSFWNKGAMATHYGTVRPSGTFSFIAGLVGFFSLTSAFLFFGYLQARTYKIWLVAPVTFAILIGAACSGSRGCLIAIGVVAVVAILCAVIRGKAGMGIIGAAAVIALAIVLLSSMSIFQEGTGQLEQRFKDAGMNEENPQGLGLFGRFMNTMLRPLAGMNTVPFFGNGLGLGTNAAAGLMNSKSELDWPEDEWGRLIFECGPVFGLFLCLFRTALAFAVGRRAFGAFRDGNVLPILIFAACGFLILNGQWGVPTNLGFAIFGAGLTLAACVESPEEEEEEDQDDQEDDDHAGV